MKTKLDLYLAVQTAAHASLALKPAEAATQLESLLTPLNLTPADRAFASQLYHSRRQRLTELRGQELVNVPQSVPAAPPRKPSTINSPPIN